MADKYDKMEEAFEKWLKHHTWSGERSTLAADLRRIEEEEGKQIVLKHKKCDVPDCWCKQKPQPATELVLLPCPFCGSDNLEPYGDGVCFITCNDCHTDGPMRRQGVEGKDARTLWNIRPPCTCDVEARVREEREACASVADGKSCDPHCASVRCRTAREIAADIRRRA